MRLTLVKQGDFLGTECDFYVDENNNIYMSRTQVGYALQYKNPSKGIENVHNRNHERINRFSIIIRGSQIEGGSKHIDPNTDMYMYIERGIYEICRRSAQPVADKYFDWVYETIQSIKQNGYYIATEKDSKWLGIRQETKAVRKMETDQIKLFVEYAMSQGRPDYSLVTQVKKSGWYHEDGGERFYNGDTGLAVINDWCMDAGKWYWFNGSGQMVTKTWYKYNGDWYYLGADGAMVKGLQDIGGKWYYLGVDGRMVTKPIALTPDADGALEYGGLANN